MHLSRLFVRFPAVAAIAIVVTLSTPRLASAAPIITLAPGTIAGYIPLDAFGGTLSNTLTAESVLASTIPGVSYAGEIWTSIGLAENGFAILGGGSNGTAVNQTLPNPAGPNNVLAPFWTDLTNVTVLQNVLTDGVSSWYVAEWRGTVVANGSRPVFQLWMGVGGAEDIAFSYDFASIVSTAGVTIGAEDKTGQYGAQLVGPLTTDLSVTTRDLPAVPAVPEPAMLTLLVTGTLAAACRRRRRIGRS
jgi:hypothetical protein